MTLRRSFIWHLVFSAILSTQAGAQPAPAATNAPAPVVVGALYNLAGFQSGLDVPSSNGARLAVSEINRRGGVLGRKLRLVLEDGRSQPEVLRAKTVALLGRYPAMTALLGLSDTDMVLGAAPVAAENGRLFLTSGATSPRLPAQVPKYLPWPASATTFKLRLRPSGPSAICPRARPSSSTTPPRTTPNCCRTISARALRNLAVASFSVRPFTTQTELNEVTRASEKPDLVFLSAAAPEDIVAGIRGLRKAEYAGPILGGDGFDAEELWAQHPELEDVFFTTHAYMGRDNRDGRLRRFAKSTRALTRAVHPTRLPRSAFRARQ